jgi:hypothetical protein
MKKKHKIKAKRKKAEKKLVIELNDRSSMVIKNFTEKAEKALRMI